MKVRGLFLILITFLFLFSCGKMRDRQLEKDIIGEWKLLEVNDERKSNNKPPSPDGNSISAFAFFEGKQCENKLGYFKIVRGETRFNSQLIYLGNKTTYKVDNGYLKIFDLTDSTWNSRKIDSIYKDTLTFADSDSVFSKYVKTKYTLNPEEQYDRIIVSTSGCLGFCPVSDISIDMTGEVLFFGQRYNPGNGLFLAKISVKDFREIETSFKKADIINLNEEYATTVFDDEAVSISFIKNNKIIKSVNDYARQSPAEFIWAYTSVRFLNHQLKLTPIESDLFPFSNGAITFKTDSEYCMLTKAETFYLSTEILKGKEVFKKFDSKYIIETGNSENTKLQTDGRFFKYKNKVIDIGYNFLIINDLGRRFKERLRRG